MKSIPYYILLFILITSCERVIDLVPQSQEPKLVVDGSIENGQPPVIFLTRSFNFFNRLSSGMLSDAFVRNANVTVSDGSRTVQLKEYPIAIGNGVVFVYSIDSTNPAAVMLGEFNTTYQLKIEFDGQSFESVTTIPPLAKQFDSLWWKPAPMNPDTNRVNVFARVSDPSGLGNYIRYFTSRNDSAFVPGFNSVFDDAFVDGITYEIQIFRGQGRNSDFDQDEFGFFRLGDRVRLKLANIDKATFDFWITWEQNQANVGNPFGVPIKVLSNISNNGLGLWAGYATQTGQLNIPR